MRPDDVRRIALALPESAERDHHGFPSFRTPKRIFATIPDPEHLHVMLDEHDIRAAVAEWWGRWLAALRVHLPSADAGVVAELLQDAWAQRSR